MSNFDELQKRAKDISIQIINLIREGKTFLIIGHIDADGISSASIIGKAIKRKKGRFIIRICREISNEILEDIKSGEYDFHIFCDLGGGNTKAIDESLNGKWLLIDHHQILSVENDFKQVINSWQFGFDGGKEVSAAGLAYFVAKAMDEENMDLSWLPVVAMVADRQDKGERRAVFGLNRKILEDAVKVGLVKVSIDILLYGRETKPIHEAMASTTTPFILNLSGNKNACLATLASSGVQLKKDGRWRSLSDLSEDEKKKVVESMIPYLNPVESPSVAIDSLIGEVYTLEKEDEHSSLRDAREFGTFLNACGRMKRAGVGVSICFDDRGQALQDGESILTDYRRSLSKIIHTMLDDENRLVEKNGFNMVIGDDLIDEDMLGSICSILSGVSRFEKKVFIARTSVQGYYKFSLRKPPHLESSVNLGLVAQEICSSYGGSGGGHETAAGCKIPTSHLKPFLKTLDNSLSV